MGATAQAANAEQPNSLERAGEFYFDIPAQPLGDALEQFGAVTGLGLFTMVCWRPAIGRRR